MLAHAPEVRSGHFDMYMACNAVSGRPHEAIAGLALHAGD